MNHDEKAENIDSLHTDKYWMKIESIGGFHALQCPRCGALIHERGKQIHIEWHDRKNV